MKRTARNAGIEQGRSCRATLDSDKEPPLGSSKFYSVPSVATVIPQESRRLAGTDSRQPAAIITRVADASSLLARGRKNGNPVKSSQ